MLATDSIDLTKDFEGYCDELIKNKETAIVGRPDGSNVVLMPLDEYNNLLQQLYKFKRAEK